MADVKFTAFVQGVNPETGNGRNPELKFTQNGRAVLNFNTAEAHSRKNQQGGYDKTGTTYRKVILWEHAEAVANTIAPGARVEIGGREETRYFEKQDGSRGTSFEVTANYVKLLPTNNQQNNQPRQQQGNSGFTNAAGRQAQGSNSWNTPQPQGQAQPHGQQQADPWGAQSGGNYDWGGGADEEPPF